LTRGIDGDAGGAADLQTDIMRFMAILSLCLMAIFALVQSIPLSPRVPVEVPKERTNVVATVAAVEEPVAQIPVRQRQPVESNTKSATADTDSKNVILRRPKWVSTFQPSSTKPASEVTSTPPTSAEAASAPASDPHTSVEPESAPASDPPTSVEPASAQHGFTLRFESDIALTRLVAAGQVGFYALDAGRARRMSISDSRISFWDASTPGSFHEMEATTVPKPVIDALSRTGVDTGSVHWGVTLPGRLRAELDTLMRQHNGGALVIRMDGKLSLEST
jgi:hypothetical protein